MLEMMLENFIALWAVIDPIGGGGANAASFGGMKAALKIMGIIDHDNLTRPFRSLTDDEKEGIPAILKELDLLD